MINDYDSISAMEPHDDMRTPVYTITPYYCLTFKSHNIHTYNIFLVISNGQFINCNTTSPSEEYPTTVNYSKLY